MQRIYGMSLQEIVEQRRFPNNINPKSRKDFVKLRESFKNVREFIRTMNETLGIYHNDLYLRNIMLDRHGKWWIIDFGEATKEYFQQSIRNTDSQTIKTTWNAFAEFVTSYINA